MSRLLRPIQIGVILVLVYAAAAAVLYRQVATNWNQANGKVDLWAPATVEGDPLAKVAWDADQDKAKKSLAALTTPDDFRYNALAYGFAGFALYAVAVIGLSMRRPSASPSAPPPQVS